MSREDFVAIGSRLFAVYLLIANIRSAPVTFRLLSQTDDTISLYLFAIETAILLLVVALLWFFPLMIARKLLPAMSEPRSEQAMDSSVGLSVGITLIGLWFLAGGIVDTTYWLTILLRARQETSEIGFEWSIEQEADVVATVVQLVVALVCILGSSGIKKLVYRLRYGDAEKA